MGVMYMTTQAIRKNAHTWRARMAALLAVLLLAALPMGAQAGTLKDMSYQALPGGKVDITLQFDGAPPQPRIFTTDNPPRIAVDLDGTALALAKRRLDVGSGATSSVTAVAAGGRTRIVVDLFQHAGYTTRVDGDKLILAIGSGNGGALASSAVGNPSKILPNTHSLAIANIDFQRNKDGAGQVIIRFSGAGANVDMHRSGDHMVVDFANAMLPPKLAQRLDVNDFATPVTSVTTRPVANGARMEIAARGAFEPSAYQSGDEYVVEIAPKQAQKAAGVIGNVTGAEPKYTGARVTFNFQDIPTRSALQLIADVSNLNIVASDSVGGSVTLRLVNVPWDQALAVIMRAKSLGMQRDGNVIWVAPQTELASYERAKAETRMQAEEAAPLVTDYIPISYGKASTIAQLLTQKSLQNTASGGASANANRGFLSSRGSVTFDNRTNTLIVSDIPQKIREIRALVAVLDRPVKQVLIESRIVIASNSFTRELGAQFGASGFMTNPSGQLLSTSDSTGSNTSLLNSIAAQNAVIAQNNLNQQYATQTGGTAPQNTLPPAITFPGGLNVNLPITSPAGSFGLAILGSNYLLNLELQAAQTEGKSETISSPRVITANQQMATIKQGQEVGYVTFQNSIGGAPGAGTATVQFKNIVLQLQVTPTITADGRIYLELDVKKDDLAGFINNPGGGQVPEIDTRQIQTGVLLDNGQTVVLGGITDVTKSNTMTKVPLLGDIPGLGALFRQTSRNNTKDELLIFVTPRILDDSLK